jgi:hypothetical protein
MLVREIKKELKRVGCLGGRVDDKWATSETKTSVRKFVKHASLSGPRDEPTLDFLESVRAKPHRVCPLECGPREIEKNGRCVAKSCPSGSSLSESGTCEKRKEQTKTAALPTETPRSAPAPKPSTDSSPPGTMTCSSRIPFCMRTCSAFRTARGLGDVQGWCTERCSTQLYAQCLQYGCWNGRNFKRCGLAKR